MAKSVSKRVEDCQRIIKMLEAVLLRHKICKVCKMQVDELHEDAKCDRCTRYK